MAVPIVLADSGKADTSTPDANATVTPTPDATATATPIATAPATPVPTPSPRKVMSNPIWDGNSVSMLVTNTGSPITIDAYIDDSSNAVTTSVKSGVTVRVSTNSIAVEPGQIIVYVFKAYENGTEIQSFEGSHVVGQTQVSPTPPPETASLSGSVVDSASSAPVEGAEVVLKSQSYGKQYTTTTDSSGSFIVASIYPDIYDIIITRSGYKQEIRHTTDKIEGMKTLDAIQIQKVSSGATSTVAPTPTPTPSPSSPLDAWMALLYSPTACMAMITGVIGLIVSLTVIYEWYLRQKERRMRDAQQHEAQHQHMQQQLREQEERQRELQEQQERLEQSSGESPKND